MLNGLRAGGERAAERATERARTRVARALSEALPGISVSVEPEGIVLFGRLDLDDERLRWMARWLP